MLTMHASEHGLILITASGTLTKADYDAFLPDFERIAKAHGPVRILLEMKDFHGWSDLSAFWEELKFDTTHRGDMGRVAVIGDRAWQKWGTLLSKPFFGAEIRYFMPEQRAQARQWLIHA